MRELKLPIGRYLVGVRYELLLYEKEPAAEDVADVARATTLIWGDSSITRVHWSPYIEHDGLVLGEPGPDDPKPEIRIVDVSARWTPPVGCQLVGVTFSRQGTWTDLPWAMKLGFDKGAHLVIALGELQLDGEPTYIPDTLLITSSQDFAQKYRPTSFEFSAWGN